MSLFAEQPQAGIDGLRAIEPATVFLDLVERLPETKPGPVWPVGSHGFQRVRDSQNARFEKDLVTLQPGTFPSGR
jgi:hypothetical protein